MPPTSPAKIGKYDVEDRVGEGAMGVVYRALDPVLKRRVAIKVMGEAFAQNDDLRERFLREAQAAGSLQHPNVITIYDFGEVDGHLFIAMEFVEGQDVAELLSHQAPLSLVARLDIAIGVLQGLAFAHKRGIVHRDIKPANIRVDADGNARIMDFGVAHFASSNMTRTGMMIGTPSYMAPEQITGGAVGAQSDIFSTGAVLYELLTGTSPFAAPTLQAVMYRVLSENPIPLERAAPGMPPKLNEIVMRAIAKEPSQRYSSALDMANDLLSVRTAIENRASAPGTLSLRATIESALDERRTSTFRRVRRRRYTMGGVGIVAAAVLVFTGWFIARRGVSASGTSSSSAKPDVAPASSRVADAPASPSPAPAAPIVAEPKREEQRGTVSPAGKSASAPPNRTATAQPSRPQAAPDGNAPPAKTSAGSPLSTTPVTVSNAPTNLAGGRGEVSPAGSPLPPPAAATIPVPAASVTSGAPPSNPPATSAATDASPAGAAAAAANNPAAATAEINGVIDAYARAIESRDLAELRRVYPTITSDQASAFGEFFKSTRTLRASLAAKTIHVEGNRATARVSGTYEFTTTGGRAQQQSVAFDVDLRRDGPAWKLIAVR